MPKDKKAPVKDWHRITPCLHCGSRKAPELRVKSPAQGHTDFVVICNMSKGGCGAAGGHRTRQGEALRAWGKI